MILRCLTLLLCLLALPLQAVQLQLKNQIFRGQLPVTIGQLFTLSGDNAELVAELPIRWQNSDGWNDVSKVVKAIRDKGIETQINGFDQVWLSLCEPVLVAGFTELVLAKVTKQLDSNKIKVDALTPLSNEAICVTHGAAITQTTVSFNTRLPNRLQSVHVSDNGKSFRLWWQADVYVYAPVAMSSIKKGETLSGVTGLDWVKLNTSAHQAIESPDLAQYRAKKRIAKGQIIAKHNAEKIMDIELGEKVKLILVSGAITIESDAKAIDGGNVDDVIRVLAHRATQPVKGKIVKKGVVYAQN